MKIERISPHVLDLTIEFKNRTDLDQWFLLSSDRHWDNPHSDRKLQKKHLEQAKERNAKILDFGDLFCVMQGKYDRRASKSNVRPEHQKDNYLDAVVNTAVDWFSPYADLFAMISEGNHESAIRRNHGGGPVTKGVIQANRKAVYLPDADFCVSGHIHEQWLMTQPRERISSKTGRTYIDEQVHICLPTYKEEYLMGQDFHRERGRPPKPLGAYWVRFYAERDDIKYEFIRAK